MSTDREDKKPVRISTRLGAVTTLTKRTYNGEKDDGSETTHNDKYNTK